jgi:hypothetical protein
MAQQQFIMNSKYEGRAIIQGLGVPLWNAKNSSKNIS